MSETKEKFTPFSPYNTAKLSTEDYILLKSSSVGTVQVLRKLWELISPSFTLTISSIYRQVLVNSPSDEIVIFEASTIDADKGAIIEKKLKSLIFVDYLYNIIEQRTKLIWSTPMYMKGLSTFKPAFRELEKDIIIMPGDESDDDTPIFSEGSDEDLSRGDNNLLRTVFPFGRGYIVYPKTLASESVDRKIVNFMTVVERAFANYMHRLSLPLASTAKDVEGSSEYTLYNESLTILQFTTLSYIL